MNAKQSLRAAAKTIEEMSWTLALNKADIKAYNQCIGKMIAGGSPCEFCEEKRLGECEHPDKMDKAGCEDWYLRFKEPEMEQEDQENLTDENGNINLPSKTPLNDEKRG